MNSETKEALRQLDLSWQRITRYVNDDGTLTKGERERSLMKYGAMFDKARHEILAMDGLPETHPGA